MFFISKKKTSKLYCWPYLKSTQQTKIDNSSIVQRLFEPDGSPQCGSRVSNSERLLFARQLWLYIFRWLMTKGLIYALLTLGRAAFASTRRRISNSSFPYRSKVQGSLSRWRVRVIIRWQRDPLLAGRTNQRHHTIEGGLEKAGVWGGTESWASWSCQFR